MKNVRSVVVFGRSDFAIPALDALVAEEGIQPGLLVVAPRSEPDETIDLGRHPLLVWAEENGVETLPVLATPEEELVERIRALEPDVVVSTDFGRSIPLAVRKLAKRNVFEIHASLLPKYRGEQPVRNALSNGEKKSGVTAALVEEDDAGTGPILLAEEIEIGPQETYGELAPRIAELAGRVFLDAIRKVDKAKKPKSRKQNEKSATTTAPMTVRHRKVPWPLDATEVFHRLRSQSPPGLNCYFRLRPVEVHWGIPLDWVQAPIGEEGTYLGMRQGRIAVLCGGSTVFGIEKICRPGGEPLRARDFAKAEKLRVGDRFV